MIPEGECTLVFLKAQFERSAAVASPAAFFWPISRQLSSAAAADPSKRLLYTQLKSSRNVFRFPTSSTPTDVILENAVKSVNLMFEAQSLLISLSWKKKFLEIFLMSSIENDTRRLVTSDTCR